MSEGLAQDARPTDKVGRVLYWLSELLALLGGFVVAIMAITITVNVTGRATNISSISGIIDMIELGTCTAVFAFLPYCQMIRANVIVDFIMSKTPTRAKTACDLLGNAMYLFLGCLLTWRLILGGHDMYKYNEMFATTELPRWYSFPYAALCMFLLIAVTAYTVWRSIEETKQGRFFDPSLNDDHEEVNVRGIVD